MAYENPNILTVLPYVQHVSWHELWSQATPPVVDIQLLDGIELSAEELLTFFPNHYLWLDFLHRLDEAGWTQSEIADFVNIARELRAPQLMLAKFIKYPLKLARKFFHKSVNGVTRCPRNRLVTDFTAQHWRQPTTHLTDNERHNLIDYPVWELSRGVHISRFPSGPEARILTFVIHEVRENNKRKLLLSQVVAYARDHGIGRNLSPINANGNPDRIARTRHVILFVGDIRRISEDAARGGVMYKRS